MKKLIIFTILVSFQMSQAETPFQELILESNFQQEYTQYRVWQEDDKFYVEHFGNSDRSPEGTKKEEISEGQVNFLRVKLNELKSLKDAQGCENREITAMYLDDGKSLERRGCISAKDPMSEKLNQLSSILLILI